MNFELWGGGGNIPYCHHLLATSIVRWSLQNSWWSWDMLKRQEHVVLEHDGVALIERWSL